MRFEIPAIVQLLAAGCATTPRDSQPLTDAQVQAIYKAQRRPQVFGITVYTGEKEPEFAGAHRQHAGHLASAPILVPDRRIPLIEIEGGSPQRFKALIDPSAGDSWMTPEFALAQMSVPLGPPGYTRVPRHVVDDIAGYLCVVQKLKIEELHVENCLVFMRSATAPLGPLARLVDDPGPDIVLGMSFLSSFNYVRFDLPRGEVFFSASTDFRAREDLLVASMPLAYENGSLAAEGMIDGTPTNIVLDLIGEYSLAAGVDPSGATRQASIGDLVFRQIPTQPLRALGIPDGSSPRLGREILDRFVITLDFRRKKIHFERPTPAAAPGLRPMVDLDAKRDE